MYHKLSSRVPSCSSDSAMALRRLSGKYNVPHTRGVNSCWGRRRNKFHLMWWLEKTRRQQQCNSSDKSVGKNWQMDYPWKWRRSCPLYCQCLFCTRVLCSWLKLSQCFLEQMEPTPMSVLTAMRISRRFASVVGRAMGPVRILFCRGPYSAKLSSPSWSGFV